MGNQKAESEKRRTPSPAGKSSAGPKSGGYTPVSWHSISLTADQKARAKESELDAVKALDILAFLVEGGHKVSFNPSTSDGFVGVSTWGHTENCPNKGFGVSGEGRTLYTALKALLLKLDILDFDLRQSTLTDEDDFR